MGGRGGGQNDSPGNYLNTILTDGVALEHSLFTSYTP